MIGRSKECGELEKLEKLFEQAAQLNLPTEDLERHFVLVLLNMHHVVLGGYRSSEITGGQLSEFMLDYLDRLAEPYIEQAFPDQEQQQSRSAVTGVVNGIRTYWEETLDPQDFAIS